MEEGGSKRAALILIGHYGTAISAPFCAIVCRKKYLKSKTNLNQGVRDLGKGAGAYYFN